MIYILYYKDDNKLKLVEAESVFNDLYYLRAKIPSAKEVNEYLKNKPNEKIKKYFKMHGIKAGIENIKREISKINYQVPLYDEYSKNLYIISRENVYRRVVYDHYRFPNENMLKYFKERRNELKKIVKDIKTEAKIGKNLSEFSKTAKIHYESESSFFILREYRKLILMIEFLKSFDLKILEKTYVEVFYYYSNEVGKNITVCRRPSFKPHFRHINPYYTRSELINLALNMELIKPYKEYYSPEKIVKLCKIIRKNDINANILLEHQKYIIENNKVGIVQYYSLQGSYFMNQYMRNLSPYKYKNQLLENSIKSMWKLINNAPKFDKSYVLYRFIKNDSHLIDLKIGDKYTVPGFMSTTRDPFYRSDVYKFGFILIKVKIPKGIKGIALCMETISHFPLEEEIILSPLTVLRLDKKDENAPYFHTDDIYEEKIKTRYEFTFIKKEPIKMPKRPLWNDTNKVIDFLKIRKIETISMEERIRYFIRDYTNPMYQFRVNIGGKSYDLITEWYDSTAAYKDFYASTTNNGFMIYTILKDYIGFTIEIGENDIGSYMFVNYYFRFSTTIRNKIISDEDFINFLSKIAFYFEVKHVIIFSDYSSCDIKDEIMDRAEDADYKSYLGGNYCKDFYDYLKYGKKRYQDFDISKTELSPKFNYYHLDRLKETDPLNILDEMDRDEIYQFYVKTYKPFVDKQKQNLADFYIYMVDKHCLHVDKLVNKMSRLFKVDNPFDKDYYVLDAVSYLYNRNLIEYLPTFDESHIELVKEASPNLPKNEYRTTENRAMRVPKSRTDIEMK